MMKWKKFTSAMALCLIMFVAMLGVTPYMNVFAATESETITL